MATAPAPPRATPLQKKVRRARRFVLGTDVALEDQRPRPALAFLALLPGLPQLALGAPGLALLFAASWSLCLAGTVWLYGNPMIPFFMGGAIGTHFISAAHPWRAAIFKMGFRDRTLLTLSIYGFLAGCLYWPPYALAGRWFIPIHVYNARPNPVVHPGDSILVRPLPGGQQPARGTLIAFSYQAGQGLLIDRVLGSPGDHIQYQNGIWKRNGFALGSGEAPLGSTIPDFQVDVLVPDGNVFAWPSLFPLGGESRAPSADSGLVLAEAIIGSPWRIAAPFSRRGPLESR